MLIEHEMGEFFISIQKILHPDLSIEVGAHEAYFSNMMSEFVEKSFAFEASPYVYKNFKNKMLNHVEYLNLAVSDKSGKESFEIKSEESMLVGNNSIKKRNDDTKKEYVEVNSISLDDFFLDKNFKKAALWIDCEGANREVLIGSTKILHKVQSIHIEVEFRQFWKDQWLFNDVYDFLKNNKFEMMDRINDYTAQDNLVFINTGLVDDSEMSIIKSMQLK